MDKTQERLKRLAELFECIPEEKQEGIVLGMQMVATLYKSETARAM